MNSKTTLMPKVILAKILSQKKLLPSIHSYLKCALPILAPKFSKQVLDNDIYKQFVLRLLVKHLVKNCAMKMYFEL